jgi:hypothetical protein
MVETATEAAIRAEKEGIECHVVDVRTLAPLDEQGLLEAVRRTGRVVIVQEAPRTCSVASEIAAFVAEHAAFDLRAPVRRVTGYDVPYPYPAAEHLYRQPVARPLSDPRDRLALTPRQARSIPPERARFAGWTLAPPRACQNEAVVRVSPRL